KRTAWGRSSRGAPGGGSGLRNGSRAGAARVAHHATRGREPHRGRGGAGSRGPEKVGPAAHKARRGRGRCGGGAPIRSRPSGGFSRTATTGSTTRGPGGRGMPSGGRTNGGRKTHVQGPRLGTSPVGGFLDGAGYARPPLSGERDTFSLP